MKFRVETATFAKEVEAVVKAAGGSVLPALSGVLLEATDGEVTLKTSDLEVAAESRLEATDTTAGAVLLPGKLLAQIAKRAGGDSLSITLDDDGDRATVASGKTKFRLRTLVRDDFPKLPEPDASVATFGMAGDAFVRLANHALAATSSDEARPVLSGVKLHFDDQLEATATDSYRLGRRGEPVKALTRRKLRVEELLVPAAPLRMAAAMAKGAEQVVIVPEQDQVSFLFDDRRLTSRLVEGSFPDADKLIPDHSTTRALCRREALIAMVERVIVVGTSASAPLALDVTAERLEARVASAEAGDAHDSIPAEVTGDPLTIAFNPRFLLDALKHTDTDRVALELRDPLKPALVRPTGDDEVAEHLTLIMPVRLT